MLIYILHLYRIFCLFSIMELYVTIVKQRKQSLFQHEHPLTSVPCLTNLVNIQLMFPEALNISGDGQGAKESIRMK